MLYLALLHAALTMAPLETSPGTVASPAPPPSPVTAPTRELVVLILIDATRPDHLGAYGYDRPTSPNIDSLAQEGRRFTRVYANAPWTRPSTASFLTGLNASRHRTETEKSKLPADVVTLAERLHNAGYATYGFCANGNAGSLAGLHKGFDHFEDPTNTYTRGLRGQAYNGLPPGPFIADKVMSHLRHSRAQREFLFVFLVDPHDPYQTSPELEKMFLGDFAGTIRRRATWEIKNNYPADERFSMMAIYDAGIKSADNAIGTMIAGLRELGLYEKATVLVSADHGEAFGEHGFYLHAHHFWDEVVRIPLVAHGFGFAPGIDDRLTQAIDVTRTIAEIGGASTAGLAGRSLLEPPVPGADTTVISEYNEFGIHRQAITDGHYKVTWQRPADAAWFDREVPSRDFFPSVSFDHETIDAFDLSDDPSEKKNLRGALPEVAESLLARLREFVAPSSSTTRTQKK